ncbi:ribonuclease III [Tenuibacillus multivorans]|uniref:Ribonuclease 3 n=1 Tax=Tenuibacillus multivorans TaxID=237069 RepID=A0A1G9Y2R4_9BACI|nr:ribonuclease III [Tenuibacillus multivorans]GEL75908.1 ribonuclease 3 [Tenuibacillus multivorans]SDN02901.1 ribonuclease-3 [Tenuibacillus multivorans]
MDFKQLQNDINIQFKHDDLLKQAFMHTSYVNEHRNQGLDDNERLEFLGDAVLELAVSQHLYRQYVDMSEGELTKFRANIVCEPSLEQFAKSIGLNEYLLLGKGEEKSGGRERPSLLADAYEALIGAIYLDQGFDTVIEFLSQFMFPNIEPGAFSHAMDYKTKLQEMVQQDGQQVHYEIVDEIGPAHDRQFVAKVYVNEIEKGEGQGRTKKEAEQHAAQKALKEY